LCLETTCKGSCLDAPVQHVAPQRCAAADQLLTLFTCSRVQCTTGEGILAIKAPWPSMMRTVFGDHERFQQTYFSAFKGYYFTGGCQGLRIRCI
jgi:acyl-coenzyme A synthetase/AMP-(fatty) acid ligase